MQLAGGNQRRHATMHVIGNPAQRVLRRRIFADGRMRVRIDQAGDRGDAVGIDGLIGRLMQIIADRLNDPVSDENGIGLPERVFQFPSDQCADVFNQDGRHERTIAKPR